MLWGRRVEEANINVTLSLIVRVRRKQGLQELQELAKWMPGRRVSRWREEPEQN